MFLGKECLLARLGSHPGTSQPSRDMYIYLWDKEGFSRKEEEKLV
jgi:hypothetical protein